MPAPPTIHRKRVYDPASPADGTRVLVDRLWPRGLSKERAQVDVWLKEVAPSPALREWFGHTPQRYEAFARRYQEELDGKPVAVDQLRTLARNATVTLLYAARDEHHNQAHVLAEYLRSNARSAHD